jgi:hypothetical protein
VGRKHGVRREVDKHALEKRLDFAGMPWIRSVVGLAADEGQHVHAIALRALGGDDGRCRGRTPRQDRDFIALFPEATRSPLGDALDPGHTVGRIAMGDNQEAHA